LHIAIIYTIVLYYKVFVIYGWTSSSPLGMNIEEFMKLGLKNGRLFILGMIKKEVDVASSILFSGGSGLGVDGSVMGFG
jgi:hypothetical protein